MKHTITITLENVRSKSSASKPLTRDQLWAAYQHMIQHSSICVQVETERDALGPPWGPELLHNHTSILTLQLEADVRDSKDILWAIYKASYDAVQRAITDKQKLNGTHR